MDYFSVIVLITVVFIFMSDRKTKTIELIQNGNGNILEEIENINKKLQIIKLETKDMTYENILKILNNLKQEYIFIQNKQINLSNEQEKLLIANYIADGKRPCGFNVLYIYQNKKWSFKKLYVDIINYLNIFNKQELSTYGVIICKKEDFVQAEKIFRKKLISYTQTEFINVSLTNNDIQKDKLKKIYINKLSDADISITLKILFLIISGSIITTNLIYSILNVNNNINSLVIALVIYYCYSYIIRYIYKPIGKQKIIASYIFPLYFIAYICVSIYILINSVIKKVHAS